MWRQLFVVHVVLMVRGYPRGSRDLVLSDLRLEDQIYDGFFLSSRVSGHSGL